MKILYFLNAFLKPFICVTESAMGVKVNAQNQPGMEYVQAIATLSRSMVDRYFKPFQKSNFLFRLSAPKCYYETQRCIKILHKFTTDVIEKRLSALEPPIRDGSFKKEAEHSNLDTKKRMAFLDVLLQSTIDGQPLTNENIREEVDTFMFAGHDTTTSGVSFTLYLIAQHSDVQAKLVAEIQQVLGNDKDRQVTYRDLQELKYVYGVGDITLPARTNISIPLFMMLRDPDYFTSPNEFMPERFENENAEKIHPFAYTPFSAGPRNCIGQKFAMLEIKSVVSKMLRHFELLPFGPDVKPIITLILRSRSGVHIGLRQRDM